MSVTPLSIDNIHCARPMADRSPLPTKYVPQLPQTVPQRKQSVFVAPSGLSSIIAPPPPPPPPPPLSRPQVCSPPRKASAKPNAHVLEQHISKIISENAAIVETLDPLWSKRYTISRNNSTSAVPTLTANGLSVLTSHHTSSESMTGAGGGSGHQQRRYSEVAPISKLQSALLGKTSGQCSQTPPPPPPVRKYSEFSATDSSPQSVIINAKDTNNNNHNSCNNSNNLVNKTLMDGQTESIVRNLLTTKGPAIHVTPPPDKTSPPLAGTHPQNPEGSIIKDLLLKSRDESQRKKSRTELAGVMANGQAQGEQESSMLVYVCTVCNIAFRNKENLEVHQVHYCKGNDDLSPHSRPAKHKMEDLVQRKVSVMARPGFSPTGKQYPRQPQHKLSVPTPPVGNILKQQLLAPNEGPPLLKKRKISEPVFRTAGLSAADIQLIEEHSVRRISVVQSTHPTAANPSPLTSKSSHALDVSTVASLSAAASGQHTVIQPVLHSGATVIDNYLSQCRGSRSGAPVPHMTTSTDPVHMSATDLVSGRREPIEILPDYMPHVSRPDTKITFKGPLLFPILKSLCANGTNDEFAVDERDGSPYKPVLDSDGKTRASDAFRQVASLPVTDNDSTNNDKPSDDSMEENEEEVEILDKDKENDKHLTPVSSPSNGLVTLKTTGAVRPRTLSLRTNNQLISSTLVSPDTPRSSKNCVQLSMNGHSYSRIGLKVTPRPVYCTIYKTQPMFVPQETDPCLSMYSNWTVSPLATQDVMNLVSPPVALGLYDSRPKQRSDSMVIASAGKTDLNSTHSSYWQFRKSDEEKENLKELIVKLREDVGETVEEVYRKLSEEVSAGSAFSADTDSDGGDVGPPKRVRIFEGGFKSNEDYTYVRGRGRGKYVCEECGIRCKKPSMLKKHIRTHTDLRPYSCRHCAFAFKTKGNLTKHMKSKAHHKKCVELGIIPVPVTIDDSQIDTDALAKQEMLEITCGGLPEDEDEDEDEGEWDEDEDDEDDEGVPIPLIELQRMDARKAVVPGQFDDADLDDARVGSDSGSPAIEAEEQEAARSLLILSGSGSESDLTNPIAGSRKTSTVVSDDVPVQEKRKVSVISDRDQRRVSQQVLEEQHRRISQVLDEQHRRVSQVMDEHQRRVSQHLMEAEQQRRISQHMDPPVELPDSYRLPAIMKPPTDPPLLSSPRKLSPIEQLQAQVQQQHQQLMQTTWTPNCADQMTRTRSYSFNDVPITPSVFERLNRPPIEPIESISDESSDESLDSFAARRYSMSVISDRKFDSPGKSSSGNLSAIPEGEEPMDLSVSAKPCGGDPLDDSPLHHSPIPKAMATGLRAGEFIPTAPQSIVIESVDGKSVCSICSKQFSKPSQLRLHINIHYFERPFRCDSCAVSFRTKGHLQKHKRSVSHFNKVNMNMTFGTPTLDNPRPFKCADCKIAFRIHGHLAKHLRSKMHIMKLECLGKLPFGMYAEMERSGVNLNEIDTTDCENSLQSLQMMAQRLYDPRQMRWASEPVNDGPPGEAMITDDDPNQVKDEPNADAFYHHMDGRERQPIPSPPERHMSSPVANQSSPPQLSPPQRLESPLERTPTAPVTGVQPTSGFTSTRSNTCHLCGRMFKGAKFLQVHLYCDHPEGSSPQVEDERHDYECDICHKGFVDMSSLQQHMLSHTTARPYVCEICDAGFTSSALLASHYTHHSLVAHKT